jgi:predicted RNase H-like nuclease (RuvC/YqgF family)
MEDETTFEQTLKGKNIMIEHLQIKNDACEKYIKFVEDTFEKHKKSTDNYISILEKQLRKNTNYENESEYISSLKKRIDDLNNKFVKMEKELEKYREKHLQMIIDEDLKKLQDK